MRIIKVKDKEYKGKIYYKYFSYFSKKIIEKLKWEKGDELETQIKDGGLFIKKKK